MQHLLLEPDFLIENTVELGILEKGSNPAREIVFRSARGKQVDRWKLDRRQRCAACIPFHGSAGKCKTCALYQKGLRTIDAAPLRTSIRWQQQTGFVDR